MALRHLLRRGVGHIELFSAHKCASTLAEILEDVKAGKLTVEGGLEALSTRPSTHEASASIEDMTETVSEFARIDHGRARRTGLPEVIYGEGKTVPQLVRIFQVMHDEALRRPPSGRTVAMATRITAEVFSQIDGKVPFLRYHADARIASLRIANEEPPKPDNEGESDVAVLAAGTSDLAVAEEAAVMPQRLLNSRVSPSSEP